MAPQIITSVVIWKVIINIIRVVVFTISIGVAREGSDSNDAVERVSINGGSGIPCHCSFGRVFGFKVGM